MDKWEVLKRWVADRHDILEASYNKTNFSADAAELGTFRAVYQTMLDLERKPLSEHKLNTEVPRRQR